MNSRFIPMGGDRRIEVGFAAMDSQIDWPMLCGRCNVTPAPDCDCQHRPAMPAEASTELGANQPPKRRLGHTGRRHSWVLRHQVQITAVLSVLAFAVLISIARS